MKRFCSERVRIVCDRDTCVPSEQIIVADVVGYHVISGVFGLQMICYICVREQQYILDIQFSQLRRLQLQPKKRAAFPDRFTK